MNFNFIKGIIPNQNNQDFSRPIYLIDGARSPFLKSQRVPGLFSAADLAVQTARYLLARQKFLPEQLDEVITGCVMASPEETNMSRVVSLRLACGNKVPAYTVQRNCASGLQAIDNSALDIACGRYDLVLAGGTEAMSRAPLFLHSELSSWLSKWNATKKIHARLRSLSNLRPKHLVPIASLFQGLIDPSTGLSMGETAEIIAHRFGITRQQMDKWALLSHQRLASAQAENVFKDELITLYDEKGHYYSRDTGLRHDTTLQQLAQLKPVFDRPFGLITAGNSSQITDGAAFAILASDNILQKYQLHGLARIVAVHWAGVDPREMGLGPVHAVAGLLRKQNLPLQAIDYWEINEAFAGQLLACLAAWNDTKYCQKQLNLSQALGSIDHNTINIDGGAIALGHPMSASGTRLVLHLAHILKRKQARFGIATLCVGGGQGGAVLLENTDFVKVVKGTR